MGIRYPTSLAVLKVLTIAVTQKNMFKTSRQKDPVPRGYAFPLKPSLLWNQMLYYGTIQLCAHYRATTCIPSIGKNGSVLSNNISLISVLAM